jgi:hypothetical protein
LLLSSLAAPAVAFAEPRALMLPERLVGELVRAIAWGGDRRRGLARIELGGERFAGTRVFVEVQGTAIRLELEPPPGVDGADMAELRSRLVRRFEQRGFSVGEW